MKTCTKCRKAKDRGEFSPHRGSSDGLQTQCRECRVEAMRRHRREHPEKWLEYGKRFREKHRERRKVEARARYAANPERQARLALASRLRRSFGLTIDEYDAIVNRPCGLCGATEDIVLDHDHLTNRVRGPLCQTCNKAIGMLGDDPERLRAAATYIDRHRSH